MNNIIKSISQSTNRKELWSQFLNENHCEVITEVGVYRGEFAAFILNHCPQIKKYIMIDAWRNLENWNKPLNVSDDIFDSYFIETKERTIFAKEKIEILKGTTTEVINSIETETLDFAYIDGDHTLRGISIDLISVWDKIKVNGFIGGDDFHPSIWQHSKSFEPTLVFPFAVHFAEAKKSKIYGLPYNQFLIEKSEDGFELIDMTQGLYGDTKLNKFFTTQPTKEQSRLRQILKRFK